MSRKKTETIKYDGDLAFVKLDSKYPTSISFGLTDEMKKEVYDILDDRSSVLVKSVKDLEREKKIQRRKRWISAMKQRRH